MLSKIDEADDVVVNEYHYARGNPKSDMQREHECVERLLGCVGACCATDVGGERSARQACLTRGTLTC